MIPTGVGVVLLVVVLVAFAVIGVRARGREAVDDHVTARGTQQALPLGLSFFASGMGAWILFAPPEIGVLAGLDAVVGYGLAAAAPFAVFAVIGPRMRRALPSGGSLVGLLRARFGPGIAALVAIVTILYMGVFLTAELVAIAGIGSILAGIPTAVTVLVTAIVTFGYTAVGGLRASLATDRWQSLLVLALLIVAVAAIVVVIEAPGRAWSGSGLVGVDRAGIESAVTLVIAVTAANLLHQGYWQRVWAARGATALRRGAAIGMAATVPVVILAGVLGILAAGAGVAEVPALAVFALLRPVGAVVTAAVLVLGVALVASSVDTLQNGLTSLAVVHRPGISLGRARFVTAALLVPVTLVALVATSVLQLFLIADLLAAAIVVPALSGLWPRATARGAGAGIAAGLIGALAAGLAATGSVGGAVDAVTFPDAVPTLPPFLGAVLASSAVTVLAALGGGRGADRRDRDGTSHDRLAVGR